MSLSSLLLNSSNTVDNDLDKLFKSNPFATTETVIPIPGSSSLKRKSEGTSRLDATFKRAKGETPDSKPRKLKSAKSKQKQVARAAVEDEDNSDVENQYLNGKNDKTLAGHDDDQDPTTLVHVSISGETKETKKASRSCAKPKYAPLEETAELREQRTIFIGNLPTEVAQKKALLKQLQRHILSFVPGAKIESTRFRSIPFKAPTSKLPDADGDGGQKNGNDPAKQVRDHDRERTNAWKTQQEKDGDQQDLAKDEKTFLNAKQKKKIAFINQEFHSTSDNIHAYMVFAHPQPSEKRPLNLPPLPPSMDPYEAAKLAAAHGDATLFMERMIRVDLAGNNTHSDLAAHASFATDPKLSVFVGNLDFASNEEDLRVFFETLMNAERGPPPLVEEAADEGVKPSLWVTRVRIVRDKETQMGKGFAYVQFADRECVDEVLEMEDTKVRFAKRKLRVQKCKVVRGENDKRQSVVAVPKGDPRLGEKLAHLPKDERKQVKASDADRVARRLAKKKARMAMGGTGDGKKRERVRKGPVSGKPKMNSGRREGKGRVSAMNRNKKK